MTIIQAITAVDELRKNMIDVNVKKALLSELDGRIYFEIIDPYGKVGDFKGYDSHTSEETALLTPYPYDSLYLSYLEQEIARMSNELPRYNNARIIFNERFEAFRKWWTRTHEPPSVNITLPMRRY